MQGSSDGLKMLALWAWVFQKLSWDSTNFNAWKTMFEPYVILLYVGIFYKIKFINSAEWQNLGEQLNEGLL